jgi:hypothetical protein
MICPDCEGKGKLQKTLMPLLSAQHAGAVGRLEKKRKPLKNIENKTDITESGRLEIYTCTLVK